MGLKFSFGAEFKREFGLLLFINQKSVESHEIYFKGQKMKKLIALRTFSYRCKFVCSHI